LRMNVTRLRQLAPLIQAATSQISRELGYAPSSSRIDRAISGSQSTAQAKHV